MDKKTFVDRLAAITGMTKSKANEMLEAFGYALADALSEDGEIAVKGIGKFSVEERPAHVGRNPSTGESIDIPKKNKIKFKVAKALKDAVE